MKTILVILFLASFGCIFSQTEDAFFNELEKISVQIKIGNSKKVLSKLENLSGKADTKAKKIKINLAFQEYYTAERNPSLCIKHLNLALSLSKNQLERIGILYKMGDNYYRLEKYDKAIYYLTRVLSSSAIDSDQKTKAKAECFLGLTYSDINNYDLSKKYLLRSIQSYTNIYDLTGLSHAYGNLGKLYYNQGNAQKALFYIKKGFNLPVKSKKEDVAISLSNIAAMYVELEQIDSAKIYITRSLKISKEINDRKGMGVSANNLATIYRNEGKTTEALKYYLSALYTMDSLSNNEETKKDVLYNVSEMYQKLGNFEKSLDYYQQYTSLKDTLFNTEKSRFTVETQEKYDASEREKQIAELKIKKQQDETEKLAMKYSIIIGVIVVLLIFVLIFWFQRAKSVREKNERNYAIASAALDSEEKERLRISQEIHDDLGGVLGMSRMLFSRTKKHVLPNDPELYKRIDNLLLEANNRSRAISHDLFSPTLKEFGIIKGLEELFNNVKEAKPNLKTSFESSGKDDYLDENIALNLYRIVQELISNTFKYAQASNVKLNLDISSKQIVMKYSDDGIGVDLAVGKHGVGLKSIQSRAKRINGDVKFQSAPGNGFGATVELENA